MKHVFETNLVRRTDMVRTIAPEELLAIVKADFANYTISAIRCSGDCECTVSIVSPGGLNFVFARDFLDVDDSLLQLGAEIPVYRDAAGEMNNMMAGTFRNMLSKGELQLRLTPPVIIEGVDPLVSSLTKAKSAIIAEIKVEEFLVYVCLWT
ncbi:MAG TPA: chemotaxis protein CheX [Opitutales bacterium]|nr:chemotaxis protein CheX [Opitutales bacterium]